MPTGRAGGPLLLPVLPLIQILRAPAGPTPQQRGLQGGQDEESSDWTTARPGAAAGRNVRLVLSTLLAICVGN